MAPSPPTPTRTRREQSRARRGRGEVSDDLLLDAAEKEFGANGYHAASIRGIAAAADVSVGTIYTRFVDKDALFLGVLGRHTAKFVPPMREIAGRDDPAPTRLRALTDHLTGYFAANPDFARILFGSSPAVGVGLPRETQSHLRRGYDVATAAQEKVFAEGAAAGELVDGPPQTLSQMYSGMIQGYQVAALGGASLSVERLHEFIDRTFTRRPS